MAVRTHPRTARHLRQRTVGIEAKACAALCAALLLVASAPARAQLDPHNNLTLQWTATGDDGTVGQVSAYVLHYSTTPIGADTTSWWNAVPNSQRLTLLPPLAPSGQTDSTHVTGLTPGTTYYFVMVALDEAANQSGYSNIASGTTQSCNAPIAAPADFRAAPDSGAAVISWTATTDPLALSLDLYRAPATGNNWTLLASVPLSQTRYADAGVSPGATYRYRASWKGTDCDGPPAGPVSVTIPATGPTTAAPGAGSMHVYPNPSSGSLQVVVDVTSTSAQPVRLRLFDMNGRWVATVAEGSYPAGATTLTWNRLGRNGQRIAPGYYELLGNVGASRVRERLVLLP